MNKGKQVLCLYHSCYFMRFTAGSYGFVEIFTSKSSQSIAILLWYILAHTIKWFERDVCCYHEIFLLCVCFALGIEFTATLICCEWKPQPESEEAPGRGCPGGVGSHFKNAYKLLNLTGLEISTLYIKCIFQCMGKLFCVEFQKNLKFHTKILPIHWKMFIKMHRWKFKSSWI